MDEFRKQQAVSEISDFRRDVDELCAVLGYYAAFSGNPSTDVSGQLIGLIFNGQYFFLLGLLDP